MSFSGRGEGNGLGRLCLAAKQVACGFYLPVSLLEEPSACAAAYLSLNYKGRFGKQTTI